jgi:hypothetical protein
VLVLTIILRLTLKYGDLNDARRDLPSRRMRTGELPPPFRTEAMAVTQP